MCVLVALPVAMPAPLAARPRPLPHFGIPVGSGRGVYHAAGAPCRRGLVLEISLLVSWVAPLEPYFLSNWIRMTLRVLLKLPTLIKQQKYHPHNKHRQNNHGT